MGPTWPFLLMFESRVERHSFYGIETLNVATPEPGPTRLASPNRNPGNACLIFFIHILLCFLFKSVVTRILGSTRRADPNWTPVYSDVFNYLIKTFSLFYFSLGFRFTWKHFSNGRPINIYIFTKCNYNEGILCLFKRYTKQNINLKFNYFVHKISHVQKGNDMICIWRGIYLYAATCSMTLRFAILSSFLSTQNLCKDKNYTLNIFMLSGSIQFNFNIQFNLACIYH